MRIRDLADDVVSPAEAFVNAVYAQASRCEALPFVLSYFPVATMNPFQRLLYSQAAECGFAIVPTLKMQELGKVQWRGRSVLHLHWLASVLHGVSTRSAAAARVDGLRADMAAWRAAGHRIVWSMHNVLPHDCRFPEAEVDLRRVLVEGVDAIHVLSNASIEEAGRHYELPVQKVFHTPHPSYEGWYPNVDSQVSARLDLDLPANCFTFLFFGSLQPYKGVLELIEAFLSLRQHHPDRQLRLVIAGKPVDADYTARILEIAGQHPSIRLIPDAVEEKQLQVLFNAADTVVVPYHRTLNSGVAMVAATFRKSLVAPNAGGVGETFAEDPGLLYSGMPGDGLQEAMTRAIAHRIAPGTFDRILEKHKPAVISEAFFAQIRQRLFAPTAGVSA